VQQVYHNLCILKTLDEDGQQKPMTQAHAFKAAELCLQAQAQAVRVAGLT